jgi:hypothetical protein
VKAVVTAMAAAGLSLAAGVLVYLLDRSAAHTALLPRLEGLPVRHVFGSFGQWLPSWAHVFGFSLLSAAALPWRTKPRYGVCAAWCAIDLAFEFGQQPLAKWPLAAAAEQWLGWTPLAQPLAAYFIHGTFDLADVAATVSGAAAAALLLRRLQSPPETQHAT